MKWKDFVRAGEIKDDSSRMEQIKSLIMSLPDANRHTLSFFIPHLQQISACPEAKMPLSSMAKVFSPTIVGYSSKEMGVELIETDLIIAAMAGILEIPQQFWDGLLAGGGSASCAREEEPWMLNIPH